MKTNRPLLYAVIILLPFMISDSYAAVAFPGAEGFGANTIGGRGGKVIKVTNLKDNGPGSFRAAVDTVGPRIIVFDVSGIINLQAHLMIKEPYLTIAGQTSPGGILVTGYQTIVNTHDVIIQHMRFRVGSHRIKDGADPETLDSFDIWGRGYGDTYNIMPRDAYNIIIDHCSFSWGVDEDFDFGYNPKNITVQWSIISEGLSHAGHPKGEHSKGMLVWGKYSPDLTLSVHHNYFAHNHARNPMIDAPSSARPLVDVTNNVVYNWYGGCAMAGYDQIRVNWKNNYVMRGINSKDQAHEVCHVADGANPIPTVYVNGNMGTNRLSQTDPQWGVSIGWQYVDQDPAWRRLTPWEAPPVTEQVASKGMADCIVAAVGATAPVRDSVDMRVANDFMQGTGTIIDNVSFPADFPTFVNASPPADKDGDGMPDAWELAHNLNPNADDSALDADQDGYTNIEEYLHHLSVKSYQYNTACMPVPVPIILNR